MSSYCRFEVMVATLLIGVLELMIAFVAITPSQHEPLHVVLQFKGLVDEFATAAFVLAGMLIYGSLRPKRKCRHIGLALTGLVFLVAFGSVLRSSWMSMSAVFLFVIAIASFCLLLADAHIHVRGVKDAQRA